MKRSYVECVKPREPDSHLDRIAARVIEAAIEVHGVLGPGLLESVYERALCVELELRAVPYLRQLPINVTYKTVVIGEARLDLLVAERVLVEIKACTALIPLHVAQVIAYLKASNCPLGLLINFNVPVLRRGIKRVIVSAAGPDR